MLIEIKLVNHLRNVMIMKDSEKVERDEIKLSAKEHFTYYKNIEQLLWAKCYAH